MHKKKQYQINENQIETNSQKNQGSKVSHLNNEINIVMVKNNRFYKKEFQQRLETIELLNKTKMKLGTDLPAYVTQLKKNYLTENQVN